MKTQVVFSFLIVTLIMYSCKKEVTYVYEVDEVQVSQGGPDKDNVKNTIEFISIAYSDLFGTTIPADDLYELSVAYSSFGDKKLIEDMIIKNFMGDSTINIPSQGTMQNDPGVFVDETYTKLYNRLPNEFEKWFLSNMIANDTTIDPELIYYSLMTANEYRYY